MTPSVFPSTQRPWFLVPMVLFMVPITGAGIDLYIPSLPWIEYNLHAAAWSTKSTITLYLLGYAIGPLIFGLLSDNLGRLKPLRWGVLGYIITCIGCAAAPNIWLLLIMRFLQGFFIGSVAITFRAITTDAFAPGKDRQRMSAGLTLAWSLGPVVAPCIGGYLQHYLGWRANFLFLLGYGVIIFLSSFLLPETHLNPRPMSLKSAAKAYGTIMRHPLFLFSALTMGIVYGSIVMFNVVGPFLIQEVLHYSVIDFGHIALVLGATLFIGSLINRLLLQKWSNAMTMPLGLAMSILSSILMFLLGLIFPVGLSYLLLPLGLLFLFVLNIFSASTSLCLSLFPKQAAMAGAIMGFIFILTTTAMSVIAVFLKTDSQAPLGLAYIFLFILCAIIFWIMLRPAISD